MIFEKKSFQVQTTQVIFNFSQKQLLKSAAYLEALNKRYWFPRERR